LKWFLFGVSEEGQKLEVAIASTRPNDWRDARLKSGRSLRPWWPAKSHRIR
jgi:hypothetical protein